MRAAENLCEILKNHGIDVLIDDRDERAGVKFVEADLNMMNRERVSKERL